MEIVFGIVVLALLVILTRWLHRKDAEWEEKRRSPVCPHHDIVWGSEMRFDSGNWYCNKCGEPI